MATSGNGSITQQVVHEKAKTRERVEIILEKKVVCGRDGEKKNIQIKLKFKIKWSHLVNV